MKDDMDHDDHWRWRALYESIGSHGGANAGLADELRRWSAEHPAHVAEVRETGRPESHLIAVPHELGFRLYAVSRILDLLIQNYQDPADGPAADPDEYYPPVGAYPAFCEALGADPIGRRGFHPFFHEIVEVRQAGDPGEPPSIVEERWPGYMMGSMLLMRAGVVVTAGARHLVAGVADRSTLYWTYRRRSRSTDDPSHGWGGNSQWATTFRRDYLIDGRFHYNVDSALDLRDHGGGGEEELDPASMIDLIRHRCSTVVDHGAGLYPYWSHHVEPPPAG
ncbi:hypothetical protein AB0F88_41955 [Streptosporangium sp. NPDC023963]|uniref:hypothetical protein n=1 Tax=Streptosporangium sp. NPDC023963 TaxID=3155608 RepID=UPI00342F392F